MENHHNRNASYIRTCLSEEPHHSRVLDVNLHYHGCLPFAHRHRFYEGLPEHSKLHIRKEQYRISQLRADFESHPESERGALLHRFKEIRAQWQWRNGRRPITPGKPWPLDNGLEADVDANIKASMIFFKESRAHELPEYGGKFPNQKIAVADLLVEDETRNPLMMPCEDNMIRYFHFPANNMVWVEEAIARYYGEQRPEYDRFVKSRPQARTKAQMLLRSEYWQGQMHGDKDAEVHARHMRSLCDAISIDPISTSTSPKNLVLFMPYLHWETDRGRDMPANVIKQASKSKWSSIGDVVDRVTGTEQGNRPSQTLTNEERQPLSPAVQNLQVPPTSPALVLSRRKILGQMFLYAAALKESMDSYDDERMIHKYLHEQPPLHPRRTLDQSYYGVLKNTQSRDRDQVVYRATTPMPHECVRGECHVCNQDITKTPRLIMVDQLWLWVLDEKTIISCFPKRWGRNKPDASEVHKSLRMRLKAARQDEIRTAFDLALIIVDQCSRVFFDRTKTIDRQPNLVDIFADAIRGVTYKQTAAFDQFLIYTHLASKEYTTKGSSGSTAMQNTLLNINTEGSLLKEIKDILDELHIMTRIKIEQQSVAEAFVKHVKAVMLPKIMDISQFRYGVADLRDPRFSRYDQNNGTGVSREEFEAAKWTLARADDLLEGISERIGELDKLRDNAKSTSMALKDLLTLKQQQAGVIEAREAVKQASLTLKQGQSIMLFTVVTIIFLPLSFFAAIFGMNAAEINNGTLTLQEEFKYMFPISLGIILTSLLLAFTSNPLLSSVSTLLYSLLSYPLSLTATYLFTKSGLYTLSRSLATHSAALRERRHGKTATMKANALEAKVSFQHMNKIFREREEREERELEMRPRRAVTSDLELAGVGTWGRGGGCE